MAKAKSVLKKGDGEITLSIEKKFDPKKFYKKDQSGFLYIWDSFKDRIVQKAKGVAAKTVFNLESFDLKQRATDEEIEVSLPEKHIFTESEVCVVIAELIARQPKGEEGALLKNGNANLFYCEAFVVFVYWYGVWYVFAWFRGDFRWGADYRVFSPAADL